MRNLIKKIAFPFLNTWYQQKTNRINYYANYGIRLKIYPGVFHPGIFLSTNIFIHFLNQFQFKNKKVLELGAGNGMISFFLAQKGADVTATDINHMALRGLRENSQSNALPITVVESDLFEAISPNAFDTIIINPPYYPKAPQSEKDYAFYCGDDFQYFKQLFGQLSQQWKGNNSIYMILSQDCDTQQITNISESVSISLNLVYKTKKRGEKNYIYKLCIGQN